MVNSEVVKAPTVKLAAEVCDIVVFENGSRVSDNLNRVSEASYHTAALPSVPLL